MQSKFSKTYPVLGDFSTNNLHRVVLIAHSCNIILIIIIINIEQLGVFNASLIIIFSSLRTCNRHYRYMQACILDSVLIYDNYYTKRVDTLNLYYFASRTNGKIVYFASLDRCEEHDFSVGPKLLLLAQYVTI